MPRRTLSPDLKKAISALSIREKDKLIFRLLPRDDKLVERLEYELLEEAATQEERRKEVATFIENSLAELHNERYLGPGFILYTMRAASGRISRHLFVTKDKYGEIALNLQLLIQVLRQFGRQLPEFRSSKARNLTIYLIKRTIKVLNLLEKLRLMSYPRGNRRE